MVFTLSFLIGSFIVILFLPINNTAMNHDFKNLLRTLDERSIHSVKETNSGILERIALLGTRILKLMKYEISSQKRSKIEKDLLKAGLLSRFSPLSFIGLRIGLLILGIVYGVLSMNLMSAKLYKLICMLLPIMCYFWPTLWLKNMTTLRQNNIQKEMPFVLSSIAVVVESGQSLTQAIKEVSSNKKGILAEEFRLVILEIEMGFSRIQSFERMMDRVQNTDLSIFLSSMIQSIEKGATGISELLVKQSDDLWKKRTEKAKSLAEKASIKLFMPLLILVLPSMLIFVLTPAVLSLIAAL